MDDRYRGKIERLRDSVGVLLIIPVLIGLGILTGVLGYYAYLVAKVVSAEKLTGTVLGLAMFFAVVMLSIVVMF